MYMYIIIIQRECLLRRENAGEHTAAAAAIVSYLNSGGTGARLLGQDVGVRQALVFTPSPNLH